jgi:hypothetical protein
MSECPAKTSTAEPLHVLTLADRRGHRGLRFVVIELYRDRVLVRLFASRPIPFADLQTRLRFHDDSGTEYTLQPSGTDVIDGKERLNSDPRPQRVGKPYNSNPGRSLVIATPL